MGSGTSQAVGCTPLRSLAGALFLALACGLSALAAPAASEVAGGSAAASPKACTPLDVALVIDDTGSMGSAIRNVRKGLGWIIRNGQRAAGGNLRIELITFKDTIEVDVPFAPNNESRIRDGVHSLRATGGKGEPEASDEALRTAIQGLRENQRSDGRQVGDAVWFRPRAKKLIILVTDARPGGFDDKYTTADVRNARSVARTAAKAGVRISGIFTPTQAKNLKTARAFVAGYARRTGGYFGQTDKDGAGTANAVRTAVALCGHRTMRCDGEVANIVGTVGGERIQGTRNRDIVAALAGPDKVRPRKGRDRVCGDPGDDRILGGRGADWLRGGQDSDEVRGGPAGDVVFGDAGKDKVFGNQGRDKVLGGAGTDRLFGGKKSDHLLGGPGPDVIETAGNYSDRVECGPGYDKVFVDRLDRVARDCERVVRDPRRDVRAAD